MHAQLCLQFYICQHVRECATLASCCFAVYSRHQRKCALESHPTLLLTSAVCDRQGRGRRRAGERGHSTHDRGVKRFFGPIVASSPPPTPPFDLLFSNRLLTTFRLVQYFYLTALLGTKELTCSDQPFPSSLWNSQLLEIKRRYTIELRKRMQRYAAVNAQFLREVYVDQPPPPLPLPSPRVCC